MPSRPPAGGGRKCSVYKKQMPTGSVLSMACHHRLVYDRNYLTGKSRHVHD